MDVMKSRRFVQARLVRASVAAALLMTSGCSWFHKPLFSAKHVKVSHPRQQETIRDSRDAVVWQQQQQQDTPPIPDAAASSQQQQQQQQQREHPHVALPPVDVADALARKTQVYARTMEGAVAHRGGGGVSASKRSPAQESAVD